MPTPRGLSSGTASRTRQAMPARSNWSARVSPPMPPPTMSTSWVDAISLRLLPLLRVRAPLSGSVDFGSTRLVAECKARGIPPCVTQRRWAARERGKSCGARANTRLVMYARHSDAYCSVMRNESAGGLSSVDNALRVLELLSTRPSLRVIEVAEHLGGGRSTTHRVLSALLAR